MATIAGGPTTIPITTRSYDNSRSHCNQNETMFTPTTVGTRGVRRLFSLPIPDDPRIEAQPLLVPWVMMGDGEYHDICIVCSMGNVVYAFDANTGEELWQEKIGEPITGSKAIDEFLINPHWGILSTPVIDADAGVLYVCCWSSIDQSAAKGSFWLHALRLLDGSPICPAVDLNGVTYQPPSNLPLLKFNATERKQRASLLMTDVGGVKTVFVAFGSVLESLDAARGWIIAVNVGTLKVTATWCSTSRYSGAGIWQAGEGLTADAEGFLYAVTGNGAFDNVTDFGESFIKLQYIPPSSSGLIPGAIKIVDWFTPFTDTGRDEEPQDQAFVTDTGTNAPSNLNDWTDQDLGSAGALLIPELDLILGAGKDGIVYVLNAKNMGKSTLAGMANPTNNYGKAKYICWFTFFPGWGISEQPIRFADLNRNWFNTTHHQHGTPAHYASKVHGNMIFTQGENGPLRAWSVDASGRLTFLAQGEEYASSRAQVPPGGMPGGMLTVSANQGIDGVVWSVIPVGDANKEITSGILLAYDAENFDVMPDGSHRMRLLWRSDNWGLDFSHPKFNQPVVFDGKIYVSTYSGRVDVYGLA